MLLNEFKNICQSQTCTLCSGGEERTKYIISDVFFHPRPVVRNGYFYHFFPTGSNNVRANFNISFSMQGLDSYRSHFTMAFEGTTDGEAENWVYEMDMETVRDPFAQRIVIQGGFAAEGFESVQVGDRQYVVLGEGQCVSSSVDEGDTTDMEIFEPDDGMGGLEKARRVRPDERVNGSLCQHFVFDETNVTWGAFTQAKG